MQFPFFGFRIFPKRECMLFYWFPKSLKFRFWYLIKLQLFIFYRKDMGKLARTIWIVFKYQIKIAWYPNGRSFFFIFYKFFSIFLCHVIQSQYINILLYLSFFWSYKSSLLRAKLLSLVDNYYTFAYQYLLHYWFQK